MKIITTEEHALIPELNKAVQKYAGADAPYYGTGLGPGMPYFPDFSVYADVGQKRIADMDDNGITMQVLSCPIQTQLLPKEEAVAAVADGNDYLAAAICQHSDRFAGFAALPWADPEAAAKELERAVNKLGYKGAVLSGRASAEEKFLDEQKFWPILEAAEALNVPIYMHPAAPMLKVQKAYYADLDDVVSARLSLFGWGWHHEAGLQILRMILAGVFDKFPKLQLLAGHWGEMVPFFLSRLDQALPQSVTKLDRTITDTFKQNVYVTPSGIFDYPQLKFCIEVLSADRIIHSVDFPFIGNEGAKPFIENAPISDKEKELVAHGNAEKLFHLK